jgi:hypothetical protein
MRVVLGDEFEQQEALQQEQAAALGSRTPNVAVLPIGGEITEGNRNANPSKTVGFALDDVDISVAKSVSLKVDEYAPPAPP